MKKNLEMIERMLSFKQETTYELTLELMDIERKKAESIIDTLEVKEVDLVIHTIIAECCDWLAMTTNLGHDEIEGCRNLMLTVKDEQLKAQKGEEDVIEKIVNEIIRLQDETMDGNHNFCSGYNEGRFDALTDLDKFLDTLK